MKYDAFISYSHSSEHDLAVATQKSLQKLAKPWFKIRNLNIFRDEDSLSASPQLWSNIITALKNSSYFIYIASDTSKISHWVNLEVEWWLENKGKDTIIIIHAGDFIASAKNKPLPLNSKLKQVLDKDPFYIDFRKKDPSYLYSLENQDFRNKIIRLAAHIHGKLPKDLESEELRVFRRNRRLRKTVIIILSSLLIISVYQSIQSYLNSLEAIRQKDIAIEEKNNAEENFRISESLRLSAISGNVLVSDPTSSIELAVKGYNLNRSPTSQNKKTLSNAFKHIVENDLGLYHKELHHNSLVYAFDISSNGRYSISGLSNNSIELWDLDKSKKIREYVGHDNYIESLTFSHDGNFFISGAQDGKAIVWDIESSEYINKLVGHDTLGRTIYSIDINANNKLCLTGSSDRTVKLWNLLDGVELKSFDEHDGYVNKVAFIDNDNSVLSITDESVYIRDINSGNIIKHFSLGEDGLFDRKVTLSKDKKLIATNNPNNTISLWDLNGNKKTIIVNHPDHLYTLDISADNKFLLTGSGLRNGITILWDLETGEKLKTFVGHKNAVRVVKFGFKEEEIFTASEDKTVKVWNKNYNWLPQYKTKIPYNNIYCLSNDKNLLFVAEDFNKGLVWNIKEMCVETVLYDYKDSEFISPDAAVFSSNDQFLYSTHDNNVLVSDVKQGSVIKAFRGFKLEENFFPRGLDEFSTISVSSNDSILVFGGKGMFEVMKQHPETMESLAVGIAHDCQYQRIGMPFCKLNKIKFAPVGNRFGTVGRDNVFRLWNFENLSDSVDFLGHSCINTVMGLYCSINDFVFSNDGCDVYTASTDQSIINFDLDTQTIKNRLLIHTSGVNTLDISSDDRLLLSADDKEIYLWDLNDDTVIENFKVNKSGVNIISFDSENKILRIIFKDGEVISYPMIEGILDIFNSWKDNSSQYVNR